MNKLATNSPRTFYVVFNNQTHYVADAIRNELEQISSITNTKVVGYFENTDEQEPLIVLPASDEIIVLNLVNYFPETYNVELEQVVTQLTNVDQMLSLKQLTDLEYGKSLFVNVGINNALFLALNDRYQIDKVDLFLQSKIDQLRNLKASGDNWMNVELGFITTPSFERLTINQFDQTFYFNSSINANPITLKAAVTKLVDVLVHINLDEVQHIPANVC